MNESEKDLKLKLRMMRLLWRLGYFVRKNVKLTREMEKKGIEITDIDVLGLKLTNNLDSTFLICDCKTGKNVSNTQRLFWLSGLMKYFDASTSYFIRESMFAPEYIELMDRLEIKCITTDLLTKLEKTYNINVDDYYGSFCKEQENIGKKFDELKKINKDIVNYVLIDYWKDPSQQQILNLMQISRLFLKNECDSNTKNFLLLYNMSMLSLSILRFSHQILMLPKGQNEATIKELLLGGDIPFNRRKELLSNFYDFMVREISRRYKQKYPISKNDFISGIIPEYEKHLIDFIIRLLNNPGSSIIIPRFLDLLTFEVILNKRDMPFNTLVQGLQISTFSLKPLRDFIVFAERSKIIDDELKKFVQSYINEFEENQHYTLNHFF